MPLPMVHLSIAFRMYALKDKQPGAEFLLGSLAPDAIHMRPNTDRADKRKTHLADDADLETHQDIRALLADYWESSAAERDFALGYAAHLLTDRIWVESLIRPLWPRIPANLSQEERRKLYYRDTDQLDFILFRGAAWQPLAWEQLHQVKPLDFPPLLTAEEIGKWRNRVIDWFDDPGNEPCVQPTYVTAQRVLPFIEHAAETIANLLCDWQKQAAS